MRKKEDNCTFNILLLEQVKSKLTGEAQDVLLNSNCSRWGEIKETLTQRFGDPRSEELLLHDLTTTFQNYNETYEKFHEKIKQKLQILLEHVSVREINSDIRISKEISYQNQALSTFKAGILQPYCRHLMNLDVRTLEQGLIECRKFDNNKAQVNFMNFMRNQNVNKKFNHSQSTQRFIPPYHQNPNVNYHTQNSNRFNLNNKFPSQPIQLHQRPVTNNFPTRSQVFGRTENKPTPMSISTRYTNKNQPQNRNNYFVPQSRQNFISEELYNVENDEYEYNEQTQNYETFGNNQNFRMNGPKNAIRLI
ncbi:hypothetical protein WA026_012610 [Henosepilachna vigintioctopunctata]|uniref:Uncharacterized protein n=1 Tax=Henosepilachna vigintioctopunctata TaxID=420089 RepID=A0AAW1TXJ9_9CUCU